MNLQGSVIVNTEYFTRLKARIDGIDTCQDLQAVTDDVMASLQGQLDGIEAQLGDLAPMIELLTLSITDLPKVITWLEHYVEHVLTPYLQPYITYAAQLEAAATAIAEIPTALEAAAKRIAHCSITVPPIVV